MTSSTPFRHRWSRWPLPNGLTVLYQCSPGLPLVSASLLVRAGSLQETGAQAGLANLTAELLLRGTRRRSASQIAGAMESIGASLGTDASEDYAEMGFLAPEDQLDRALEVLVDSLVHPTFPKAEIETVRSNILAGLRSRKDSIFCRAYDVFCETLFGSHAYGRLPEGRPDTLQHLKRNDLLDWHARYLVPNMAVLSLIGSMPASGIRTRVERHFRSWKIKARHAPPPSLPSVLPPLSPRQLMLKAPFEQAYLMTGTRAPSVSAPAYLAVKVLTTLLGGGMSSRLFVHLREESSLAYEVSSFFPSRLQDSLWGVYLGLAVDKLPFAQDLLEKTLRDLQREGPTAGEFDQAVEMIRGAYLMEQQSRRRRGWRAAWRDIMGEDGADTDQFFDRLQAVKPAAVRQALDQLLAGPRVTVTIEPEKLPR